MTERDSSIIRRATVAVLLAGMALASLVFRGVVFGGDVLAGGL